MRRRGSILIAVIVGVLLAVAMAASVWLRIDLYQSKSWGATLMAGQLWLDWGPGRILPSWWLGRHDPRLLLAPDWIFEGGVGAIYVPLWAPLLLCLAASFIAWRGSRRRSSLACEGCGYDLAGIDGPCPECGRFGSKGKGAGKP